MRGKIEKAKALFLAVIFTTALFAIPASASVPESASFTPNPQTPYANEFIEKCEGQGWFMDIVESALNISARSINTLRSKSDLDAIASLAVGTQINGHLPPAIGELGELTYLFLSGVGLSGEIPSELYNCTKLENIDMSGNALTGSVSPDIVKLASLKVLLLHGNQLTGAIPEALPALENLDLADNNLTGGIPESVYSATTLRVLALSNNPLGGEIPHGISLLGNLRVLLMWDCSLTGAIPEELGDLASLQALDISQNNFDGNIPSSISNLTLLERFAASGSGLSGGMPDSLASLTNLAVIDLSNNAFTGEIPSAMAALTKLRTFVLDGNAITGELPDIWGGMSDLKTLWLRGNKLVGDVPASLVEHQATGADVRIDRNYLSGENAAQITSNAENFIDGPLQDVQYRIRMSGYIQVPIGSKLNVWSAFTVRRADNGMAAAKVKLPTSSYQVVLTTQLDDPDEHVRITSDANGIYIELLKNTPISGAIRLELRMLPHNSDAPYTFTTFSVGTERPQPQQDNGGGGTRDIEDDDTPKSEMEDHTPYITGVKTESGEQQVRADAHMTREEAAMILYRLGGEQYTIYDGRFKDVEEGRWSESAIAYVSEQEIMTGYEDGTFQPTGNMTRAEFATILVRFQGYEQTDTAEFPDAGTHWARGYIGAAKENGLMKGYEDGTFRPEGLITRAEVVTAMNRALGRVPDEEKIDELENPFIDISPMHWAYYQIMEAATDHLAEYEDGEERWIDD